MKLGWGYSLGVEYLSRMREALEFIFRKEYICVRCVCVVLENLCYSKHCYHNYLIFHNYPIAYQKFLTFSPKETNELKGKYISTDHNNKWQKWTSDASGLCSQMRYLYNHCEMPDLVYCLLF